MCREDAGKLIHQTAIVDPSAKIADDVEIGPYTIIGADVEIGPGTVVGPHVVINGPTRIGANNRIFQFCSLGEEPQDKKYAGEPTTLVIGDNNTIREYVTMNRGTVQDGGVTSVGNDNWIMAYVHIAHDCHIGNNTIMANATSLAGHVTLGDNCILGGFTVVHQFCKIGAYSFSALGTIVLKDIPPYVMVSGNPARAHGINFEGLKRRNVSMDTVKTIKRAYKVLYKSGELLESARAIIADMAKDCDELQLMVEFLENSDRGIVR